MAKYCEEIFGDLLLKQPLEGFPVRDHLFAHTQIQPRDALTCMEKLSLRAIVVHWEHTILILSMLFVFS